MHRKTQTSKDKKLKRKEELEKSKIIDETVKTAAAKAAPIEEFPSFLKYGRNGLDLRLEAGSGETLSYSMKEYIQKLLKVSNVCDIYQTTVKTDLSSSIYGIRRLLNKERKQVNMEGPYGPNEWPSEEKAKRREMVSSDARYIFVRKSISTTESKELEARDEGLCAREDDPVVAFVQYRFVVEHEVPALYVYEIQLEQCIQGKGLGKFLMQFLELIARKNNMKAVILTVQKRNSGAMAFYTTKLRYNISSISPSRWANTLSGADRTYEILCKTFDADAKAILEERVS